jgi:hypothetical protein
MKGLICASALLAALPLWAAEPAPTRGAAVSTTTPATQDLQPAVNTSAAATAVTKPANSAGATPATTPQGAGLRTPTASAARSTLRAQDRLDLDTTQITGNRELPRVLYVVPWKRSDLGDLTGKPANSLLDEVLAPVDRDVFRRQNRYYDALKLDTAAGSGGSSTEVEK